MIFAAGAATFIVAWFLNITFGSPSCFYKNNWDHATAWLMLAGIGAMSASVLIGLMRILP